MAAKSKKLKPKKRPPKIEDAKQSSRFLETANSLHVDKTGAAFERALDVVVPRRKR
jgi:hypothetical protein